MLTMLFLVACQDPVTEPAECTCPPSPSVMREDINIQTECEAVGGSRVTVDRPHPDAMPTVFLCVSLEDDGKCFPADAGAWWLDDGSLVLSCDTQDAEWQVYWVTP